MAYDGLTLAVCAKELKTKLLDAKVQKILMPNREEVVLALYCQEHGTVRLVLNADAGNCAVYLTAANKPNPKTAPAFCMLLRKYLIGARILDICQKGLDRVLLITLEAKDELMQKSRLTLVAEIMGKHSNIILVGENGRVLDCVRRVSVDVSSKRQVLPGSPYLPPPTEQINPLEISEAELANFVAPADGGSLQRHLCATFQGMSSQTAAEIIYLCETKDNPSGAAALASCLRSFYANALASPLPSIQTDGAGLPVFFSVVPYHTYSPDTRVSFDSANKMLDTYYTRRGEDFALNRKKDALAGLLKKNIVKLNKKIKNILESLEEAKKSDEIAGRAQLITANIYRLQKGMSRFEAQDFATGDTVVIPLDLSLTPAQNAQKLFKKSSKLKTAKKMGGRQLAEAEGEREYLENALLFVQKAEALAEIEEIQFQLFPPDTRKDQKSKRAAPPPESAPREFKTPRGHTILVGKNDRQNDIVTMRIADKNDIWFHAKNMPGSHVLLISQGIPLENLDDESILMAARLAAKYSAAGQSGKTPVDYTQRANVKKPPASRPGKVIYDHYFTMYVEPL